MNHLKKNLRVLKEMLYLRFHGLTVFRLDFFKILQKVIENEDAAVLMTSHIQEEMQRKMDYAGILENGRLVSFGEM